MITLTSQAAKQVKIAAEQSQAEKLSLRIAAKKNPDGSMEYGMGFDDATDDDMLFTCEGIEVIFAPEFGPLLSGTVIDYVELNPGEHHFIFMNPNDANYTPPGSQAESSGGCGGGDCSCH